MAPSETSAALAISFVVAASTPMWMNRLIAASSMRGLADMAGSFRKRSYATGYPTMQVSTHSHGCVPWIKTLPKGLAMAAGDPELDAGRETHDRVAVGQGLNLTNPIERDDRLAVDARE